MMHPYGGGSFGLFGIGWIFMFIVWILIILAVVALVKWATGHDGHRNCKSDPEKQPRNSALEIIRERYAKGEINKEEFDQKQKDLQ